MLNKTILISGGCSFTQYDACWPNHLSKFFNLKLENLGLASQGNALIARKLHYFLNTKIYKEKVNPKEILVGVMWSAIDRSERYIESGDNYVGPPYLDYNPTKVASEKNNWRILSHEWDKSEDVKKHFTIFNNKITSFLHTIEHITRIQLYLEHLGVSYFMSNIMDIFSDEYMINHPDIKYAYNQIDFSKFLPVRGCFEWVKENYPEKGFDPPKENGYVDWHPTEYGQIKFTEEVILPFINDNKIYFNEKNTINRWV